MTVTDQEHGEPGDAHGAASRPDGVKEITIQVNSSDVRIAKGDHTGHEIKAAAIAQGVTIELGFVLSVQHGNHYETIGDDDVVKVHPNMDFIAVAQDDNS